MQHDKIHRWLQRRLDGKDRTEGSRVEASLRASGVPATWGAQSSKHRAPSTVDPEPIIMTYNGVCRFAFADHTRKQSVHLVQHTERKADLSWIVGGRHSYDLGPWYGRLCHLT